MTNKTTDTVKDLDFTLEPIDFTKDSEYIRLFGLGSEPIDFTKDSEYIRLFGDDDVPEKYMESVYKKELGSSFEKMENGVSVGSYKEDEEE